MAGGATFSPKLLVDGKRPFDRYPSGREVLCSTLASYATRPIVPTAFAVLLWPAYRALATRWRRTGLSEAGFCTLVFCTMITSTYASINSFFAIIERMRYFEKYKIDRHAHQLGDWKLAYKTLKLAVLSRLSTPLLAYAVLFRITKLFGMNAFDKRPSLLQFYRHFLTAYFVNEVGFYWAHRCVHSPSLYAKIHKQHHEWKGTVSYAAEYAHPVEQLFANYLPTFGGCILVGAHPWTFCVWVCERLRLTYEAHSGYAFKVPVLDKLGVVNWKGAADHDFHHTGNSGNFGALWLDWLCGTMDAFAIAGGAEGYIQARTEQKLSYMSTGQSKP